MLIHIWIRTTGPEIIKFSEMQYITSYCDQLKSKFWKII